MIRPPHYSCSRVLGRWRVSLGDLVILTADTECDAVSGAWGHLLVDLSGPIPAGCVSREIIRGLCYEYGALTIALTGSTAHRDGIRASARALNLPLRTIYGWTMGEVKRIPWSAARCLQLEIFILRSLINRQKIHS